MYLFGAGVATITPLGVSNPTPVNIGLLNEISVDVSQSNKALYGQYRDPIAIGSGTRKWSGKAKVARIGGNVLNALLIGGTIAAGMTSTAIGEAGKVPGSTAYTITTLNASEWTADQGVVYAATGLPLTRVASVSAAAQYSVSAGVYTFDSADANANVLISYNYTVTGSGQTIVVPQALIGAPLSWSLNASVIDPTTGKFMTAQFGNCVCDKLSWGTKLEDFALPEIDFMAYANAAGTVCTYSFADGF